MDRFKINGDKLVNFYSQDTELQQVFKDIEADLKATNKVVCQFIVNGIELGESDEINFSEMKLGEVTTLEYLSEDINELLIDVLKSWSDAIPEMITNTEKLSKQIRFDGVAKSLANIQVLIENYEYLISSIISIKNLLGDSAAAGLSSLSIAEEKTKMTLEEALSALEKRDFVCLADIVEYELITSLQNWDKLLTDLLSLLTGENTIDSQSRNGRTKIISSFTPRGRMAN